MTRDLTFYKEDSGRWYVDISEWEGEKADLEMVSGADTMLDVYSGHGNSIALSVSDLPLDGGDTLIYKNEEEGIYNVSSLFGQPYSFDIWLCSVTQFVFGDYPERIYIKKV